MNLQFANYQYLMSERAKKSPKLGKLVSHLLGTTNIGQYARANMFRKVLSTLPIHQFESILDLGCGQGEYAFMMANAFKNSNLLALDPEPERINKINYIANAQMVSNLKTHAGTMETLKKDLKFDLIYSVDVFEHIKEKEMPFASAFDHLNEGGYLLIKMPTQTQRTVFPSRLFEAHNRWLEEEHIGQVYMLEDLEARMRSEGFNIVYSAYSDGILSRLSWELSYLFKKRSMYLNLLFLPFLKLLVRIDRLINQKDHGNAIQVIGQKIQKDHV